MSGKVAMVTGAGRGIGGEIARAFVEEGARVVLVDISAKALAARAAKLGSAVTTVECDVSDSDNVLAAVNAGADVFGGLDIVVNSAAVGASAPLADMDPAAWQHLFAVDLGGVLHTLRHAVPAMRERGRGAFVNISSIAASRAMPGLGAYAAAKAGVEALTRTAALELRGDSIRVNAIAPGLIRTRTTQANDEQMDSAVGGVEDYIERRQGRWGEPDEVAAVALHLAGDAARFTNGQTYVLDNGATAVL